MSIGTAQPTIEEMDGVKHHLIGFQEPSEPISAGEYSKLVIDRVKAIRSDSKVPIICGGAGLYYRAISKGIFEGSTSDISARHRLEESYDNDPIKLLEKLRSIDPEYAELVHLNNKKRLVRALEIFEVTGKTPSENFINQISNPTAELDLYTIQLKWTRNILNKRIMRRTDAMLDQGWIREVELLLRKQKNDRVLYPAINSIGYDQIQSYLNNKITHEEMREEIIVKTRQFAKKQAQWFEKEPIDLTLEMDNLDSQNISQILYCLLKVIL